jgi:hypothetical protein
MSVACEPFMVRAVMLNVIMLNFVAEWHCAESRGAMIITVMISFEMKSLLFLGHETNLYS